MYSPRTRDERKAILGLLVVSGAILLAIAVYYFLNQRAIVGDSLVNNAQGMPAEFPPPSISPLYVKPVTIMYVSGVVFAFCFFALIEKSLGQLSRKTRVLLLVVSISLFAIRAYETLFNFTLWGSLLVTHPNPDTITNDYPVSSYTVNLVFATKAFVVLLFVTSFAYLGFKKSLEDEKT